MTPYKLMSIGIAVLILATVSLFVFTVVGNYLRADTCAEVREKASAILQCYDTRGCTFPMEDLQYLRRKAEWFRTYCTVEAP
jgi:hypothetical protein